MSLSAKKTGLIVISALFVILFSCRKKEDIGLQLQPQHNQTGVFFTDTFSLKTYAVLKNDSLVTSGIPYLFVGAYTDPVFGQVQATAYSQITPPENYPVAYTQIDSVILHLDYTDNGLVNAYTYGDTLNDMSIGVRRISKANRLHSDSSYFSVHPELMVDADVLDSGIVFQPRTSRGHENLHLKKSFGEELMRIAKAGITKSAFIDSFPGIALIPQTPDGALLRIPIADFATYITVYYNGTEKREMPFYLSNTIARFSRVVSDRTGLPVLSGLTKTGDVSDAMGGIYMQSLIGVQTKILFPTLLDLKSKLGNISVNRAELIMSIDPTSDDKGSSAGLKDIFTPIADIDMIKLSADEQPRFYLNSSGIYDYQYVQEDWASVTGVSYPQIVIYQPSINAYVCNISAYVQAVLYGVEGNNGLIISPLSSGMLLRVNRTIAGTGSGSVKLKVYYTLAK